MQDCLHLGHVIVVVTNVCPSGITNARGFSRSDVVSRWGSQMGSSDVMVTDEP